MKWLGEIPSHWDAVRVKHLFIVSRGRVIAADQMNDEGEYPVYSSQTENNGCMGYISTYDYEGDVLTWTTDGAKAGTVFRRRGKFNCTNVCGVLTPITNNHLGYLYYAIYLAAYYNKRVDILGYKIMSNEMAELKFPLPPFKEQTAIANYLDTATAKIDAAIAQQQKMIDLLNERKQIIINRAVTKGLNPNAKMKDSGVEWIGEVPCHWECRKLKSICANTQYSIKTGPFGSQLKGDDIQEFGDVPIYNQRVVIDNDCYLFNSYVSKAKADALKSFVVKSKDLLITTRGTIGKSTIVPNDAFEGILHPCIIAIRLNFDLCWNEYMQYFFQSIAFNTDMTLKSNATTIEVIYSYNLKECFVPLPPIDEQKQIVEYLNEELVRINQTIDATINQISLLQERKQIIINEVVTGKVKIVNCK